MNAFPPTPPMVVPDPNLTPEQQLAVAQAADQAKAQQLAEQPTAPVITHHQPILTFGANGEPVKQLVELLAACGHATNKVIRGESPDAIFDTTVMSDVQAFLSQHGLAEPDELYAGQPAPIAEIRGKWVGPHTWQALYDEIKKLTPQGA
jgi:hypothetical protein